MECQSQDHYDQRPFLEFFHALSPDNFEPTHHHVLRTWKLCQYQQIHHCDYYDAYGKTVIWFHATCQKYCQSRPSQQKQPLHLTRAKEFF